MLNSAEHEILNGHKYKNAKKFSIFQAQIRKSRMLFFRLDNVKMPTIVGILTFLSWEISCMLSQVEHEFFFITFGPDQFISF